MPEFKNISIQVKIIKSDQNGQGTLEYGLILLLVSTAAIIVMSPLGKRMMSLFKDVVAAFLS